VSRLDVGAVIDGKYRLERVIGEGGMGSVWRAHHLQLDLPVAIKLLRAGPDDAMSSARLKIEARAAARLSHPAIVRVFDVDATESNHPFIVMELLDGESLSDMLDRAPLSGVAAVQLLLPIAEALVLAHSKGIAHRDLKPHNIFLCRDGERLQPKLLDFGIAKLTGPALPAGSLTDTGVLLGSPDYMSPEQARGRSDIDYRADIWQFCVVLYESITTQTPFRGDNYNALMRAIVEDEPEPLPRSEHADARLAELIDWGLQKDRENRPESVQLLAQGLAQWLLDRGVLEDACGSSVATKWLARGTPPPDAPRPPLVTRPDTLPSGPPSPAPPRWLEAARRHRASLATVVVLLFGVALLWLRSGSAPGRPSDDTEAQAEAATAAVRVVEVQSPRAPGIASAVATPASVEAELVAPLASSAAAGNLPGPSSKMRASAPDDARRPAPSAKPAHDVADGSGDLLQAY
jgi:serine/threonine-protein kinase